MYLFNFIKKSVGRQLAFSFMTLVLLLIASVVITLIEISKIKSETDMLTKVRTPTIEYVLSMQKGMNQYTSGIRGFFLYGSDKFKAEKSNAENLVLLPSLDSLKKLLMIEVIQKNTDRLNEIDRLLPDYLREIDQIIDTYNPNSRDSIQAYLSTKLVPVTIRIKTLLEELYKSNNELSDSNTAEVQKAILTLQEICLAILLVGVLSGIIITVIRTKATVRPIKMLSDALFHVTNGDLSVKLVPISEDEIGQLTVSFNTMVTQLNATHEELNAEKASIERKVEEAVSESETAKQYLADNIDKILIEMGKFAEGDLTVELFVEREDEIGKLFFGFNRAIERIRLMMQQVAEVVSDTANATAQISSSTEQMSKSAQEQTDQTLEVASGMEEMTKTIQENTKNAGYAASAAKKSEEGAQQSSHAIVETIQGMIRIAEVIEDAAHKVKELGNNSEKIGDIVQVIDEIANQTNLLALNAAIEAARAGEHGRGFAVVADEVRKLSERTSKATKEIAIMIKHIQNDTNQAVVSMQKGSNEVENGKTLANKAGNEFKLIVNDVNSVVDIATQVAVASEEQSSTSEEIARNLENISNISRENGIATQQIANAAEDLNNLTTNLQELLNQFIIDKRNISKLLSMNNSLSKGLNRVN